MADPERELEQFQRWHIHRRGPDGISELLTSMSRQLAASKRRTADVAEVWQQLVPAHIIGATALGSVRGGVLKVQVGGASVRYELDRLLREGLLKELRAACGGTLRQVRLEVTDLSSSKK